jgi:hypothetical protein
MTIRQLIEISEYLESVWRNSEMDGLIDGWMDG